MPTSFANSGELRAYTAQSMLERALRQAGVKTPAFTSEMVEIAFDIYDAMLSEMMNLGIQLWARDEIILPLYKNTNEVPTPPGTSLILDTRQRTLMRPQVLTATTDQGGNALLAFDGDLATSCVNLLPNGSITALFDGPTLFSTIGINFTSIGQFVIFLEWSNDSITWTPLTAYDITITRPGQWFWSDLQGSPSAIWWRIRSVGVVPLSIAELYLGNNPTEIPMGVWNVDDWDAMVVKNTPGVPWNWYQQRDLDTPTLFVWPMPDITAVFLQLVCRRRRMLDQVTDMEQTVEVPRRWYEALTSSLARRLCKELPEADFSRFNTLKSEETADLMLATSEERDPAPERYNPGLEVYKF
jgi:hypothetical protein